jgi:hypothetical protein
LRAARDLLVACQKHAGWLPEQRGYSTTLTDHEMTLARGIESFYTIIARSAALTPVERTCGTCRYHVDGWQCNETGPTYLHETPTDFGCTLHQPQEPPT